MPVQAPRRLFTVDEFHQMAEAGIFHEDDRIELLSGEIVEMTPIGSRHAACVDRLTRLFFQALSEDVVIRVQNPLRLDDYSEPEPDLAVVKAHAHSYRDAHPGPTDVLLVVEVAETCADIDRADKVPRYGRSGVPEVWVVDLHNNQIDVYRVPTSDGYREHETVRPGGTLRPRSLPSIELAADSVII